MEVVQEKRLAQPGGSPRVMNSVLEGVIRSVDQPLWKLRVRPPPFYSVSGCKTVHLSSRSMIFKALSIMRTSVLQTPDGKKCIKLLGGWDATHDIPLIK